MYIDSIIINNIGPIDKCVINTKFDEKGNPYPLVIIGDNGKGKTVLSSYIADSIIEIAKSHGTYNNAVETEGAYYRIIGQTNVKNGKVYGDSIISFKDASSTYTYVEKAGDVDLKEVHSELIGLENGDKIESELLQKNHVKTILGINNKEEVENIFNNNVLCFFPSYRSEKPVWMNENAIKYNEIYDHERYNGKLNKEIIVEHSEERNSQWISSVIVDSLIDIVKKDSKDFQIFGNIENQQLLRKAKENLEVILKYIFKTENAKLYKEYRNSRNAFKIICEELVEGKSETVNSLKHFSLGQAVLFNMFATIIRHADINDIMKSINLSDIEGIVVIDEIDLHLDSEMQYEVLPKLIKLFPKIQFIITTHSPLFLLGMDKDFEQKYMLVEMPDGKETSTERFSEFENSYYYLNQTKKHEKEINKLLNEKMEEVNKDLSSLPLIITEGPTDWRHLKHALEKFQTKEDKYTDLKIQFLEYDDSFGESELVKMKNSLLMLPNTRKYILISDRDTTNKSIEEFENEGSYKKWNQNVYTMRIPVPNHRKNTPNISIEHYYTDEELKTEVECDDAKRRRLYIGNEFNKFGFNSSENKVCEDKNKCGKEKICIISGTGKEKVFDVIDDEKIINLALSKKDFVERIVAKDENNISYKNFSLIFDQIQKIIDDDN